MVPFRESKNSASFLKNWRIWGQAKIAGLQDKVLEGLKSIAQIFV